MAIYALTSFVCTRNLWCLRQVRCLCRVVKPRPVQICAIEAETPAHAAALFGGEVPESTPMSVQNATPDDLGQSTSYLFRPGRETADRVLRTYPSLRHYVTGAEFLDILRLQPDAIRHANLAEAVRKALQDDRRHWRLVTIPLVEPSNAPLKLVV